MNVVFRIRRHIVINNQIYVFNVQSTWCDIGTNQNGTIFRFEFVESTDSSRLKIIKSKNSQILPDSFDREEQSK